MKKIAAFTALCAVILALLASCSGNTVKRFNLSYPLDVHSYITFDGREYEANISISDENNIRISFSAPESLKNTVLEMRGDKCYLSVYGITISITDGGYAIDNGLLLIRQIFSISGNNYTDADVIKSSGIEYCVENYVTKSGRISAYFSGNTTLPEKISATLRGHQIEIVIVN